MSAMEILTLSLGAYQTNCYLFWEAGSASCGVIDPGYHPEQVLQAAAAHGKTVGAILLTHGHFDHVGAVKAIRAATRCPVYLHPADKKLPFYLTKAGLDFAQGYEETVCVAGVSLQVIPTPGHSAGSVCLKGDGVLFSGDTLFADTCGRTDLPGGNPGEMMHSLRLLTQLPGDYTVYPGHGEATTLSRERLQNPYLKGIL